MNITRLVTSGNAVLAIMSDGSRVRCYRTPTGVWVPRTGGGVKEGNPNPDPGDPGDPPKPGGSSPYKWPMNPSALNVRNGRLRDGYMTPQRPTHNGTDMSFPPAFHNGMPIRSIADGEVVRAYWEPGGGGYAVEVRHSAKWISGYYHGQPNSFRVSGGQKVKQGQHLMDAGETGYASGPHLHFMMCDMTKDSRYWHAHVDPVLAMKELNPNDEYV